jgi:hypothetical protein
LTVVCIPHCLRRTYRVTMWVAGGEWVQRCLSVFFDSPEGGRKGGQRFTENGAGTGKYSKDKIWTHDIQNSNFLASVQILGKIPSRSHSGALILKYSFPSSAKFYARLCWTRLFCANGDTSTWHSYLNGFLAVALTACAVVPGTTSSLTDS